MKISEHFKNYRILAYVLAILSFLFLISKDWFRAFLEIIVSWPIIFLVCFACLILNKRIRQGFIELLKPFQKIKFGSTELVLNKEEAARISKDTKEVFGLYRKQVNGECDLFVERHNVATMLEEIVEELRKHPNVFRQGLGKLRCTIHVSDILFANSLYQLLDYYPGSQGKGRIKSIRFGIIGKAWRSRKSITQGEIPTDTEDLIVNWGMTRGEATIAGVSKQSFSCVVLRDENTVPVGIFYMDAEEKNAFAVNTMTKEELHKLVTDKCEEKGLTEILAKLNEELRGRAPLIRIYD